jgi:hypothetical protein
MAKVRIMAKREDRFQKEGFSDKREGKCRR